MTENPRKRILLVGGSGVVGSILRQGLDYDFVVLDTKAPADERRIVRYLEASAADSATVSEALDGTFAAIHLATGAPNWSGLLEADMIGLKVLCEQAVAQSLIRVIYASSNHVVGMVEREAHARGYHRPYPTDAPSRPDSLYGVAKQFGESLCRFYAETTPLATSCIRIGTVRPTDDLEKCAEEPYFSYIQGGRDAVLARLQRTWLYHDDLIRMFEEELSSSDKYRLRFGISSNADPYWSTEVLRWSKSST